MTAGGMAAQWAFAHAVAAISRGSWWIAGQSAKLPPCFDTVTFAECRPEPLKRPAMLACQRLPLEPPVVRGPSVPL